MELASILTVLQIDEYTREKHITKNQPDRRLSTMTERLPEKLS